ncbi:MAG: hypothetical protein GY722_30050 [bacterium]|nr:hypothetical protein [bacterium]
MCVALLVASCAGNAITDERLDENPTATPVARRVATDTRPQYAADYASLETEGVIYAAPLVVRGVVESVEGPFWNVGDGQRWQMRLDDTLEGPADYTVPVMYRDVTLSVKEILRSDHGFDGDKLTVYALGGGEKSEDMEPFVAGRFVAGDDVILFLSLEVFYMREEPIAVYQPFYQSQGVYHVVDGDVLSAGHMAILEAIEDPKLDPLDKPEMPATTSVEDFLAQLADARKTTDAKWEVHKPAKDKAYGIIDMLKGINGDPDAEGDIE